MSEIRCGASSSVHARRSRRGLPPWRIPVPTHREPASSRSPDRPALEVPEPTATDQRTVELALDCPVAVAPQRPVPGVQRHRAPALRSVEHPADVAHHFAVGRHRRVRLEVACRQPRSRSRSVRRRGTRSAFMRRDRRSRPAAALAGAAARACSRMRTSLAFSLIRKCASTNSTSSRARSDGGSFASCSHGPSCIRTS